MTCCADWRIPTIGCFEWYVSLLRGPVFALRASESRRWRSEER
jgi:hypothetical protein